MAEENEQSLRMQRRNAKAKFTRSANAMRTLTELSRQEDEVNEVFSKVREAYEIVQIKHEQLIDVIEDDEEFEKQEDWMLECQGRFLELSIQNKDYGTDGDEVDDGEQNSAQQVEQNEAVDQEAAEQQVVVQVAEEEQKAEPVVPDAEGNDGHEIAEEDGNVAQGQIVIKVDEGTNDAPAIPHISASKGKDLFKIERPKLPKFSGDVRDYYIFRADFRQFIESRYRDKEAVTILRSSLNGKPLELIRGLGRITEQHGTIWMLFTAILGSLPIRLHRI
ncbi:uncharacterized protein LOC117109097 isoform X3 [Anneissia japonica]|uniref:uncharacterized protein LOC117109097 isoform X3 n=1 Tax=Anneissia japonica TaxID=1529436 RepID=UPI0014254E77|nr:uncharacterized protein LOC117109097 isoform X3 [Anneissia japonica]